MTNISDFDFVNFKKEFDGQGYSVIPQVYDADFIKTCRTELGKAIEKEKTLTDRPGEYGMVLMCPVHHDCFIDVLNKDLFLAGFEKVLGESCIVYSYTSSSMPPKGTNYSHRIHVDCPRLIPNYITNMGAIVALDDFTEVNGSTLVLPGSQWTEEAPSEGTFNSESKKIIMNAGDVAYLNSRLWHSGGVNETDQWRHSITIGGCRPWMKQRMDIPRLLGDQSQKWPDKVQQKLGYFAQPPAHYNEYYAPPEKRSFRQDNA